MADNNHTAEDSGIELVVLEGDLGNNDFNIDLGVRNYIIKDTGGIDTLTFSNTKIGNLEYSNKYGRAYIRDKKTKNVVTFDDTGYDKRQRNVDKTYDFFNLKYQSIDMNKALDMYSDTGIRFHDAQSKFHTMYDFYQKGWVPANLLSESASDVINKLDNIVRAYDSLGDEKKSEKYTTIKKAFSEYTSQLIKLETDHTTVIEKIKINNKVYNVNDLLVSKPLEKQFSNHNKVISNISDLADITNVKILKDNYSDYIKDHVEGETEEGRQERIDKALELFASDTMVEYMAGFKDLGQELGIQRKPHYFDFNPMPQIAAN
ncbi:TPA: hypothetical protein PXP39_002000 [Yersinia enterocolitica]|nr:hypothetical protein [Yersinia enterocolitica]HDL7832136.1 hypothetical protein [Yersinia enterocolitica]HDL7872800.1 hypothetical protein [Yersinia enterocolitica]HDL7884099.1 hypothetical protein [Yersinia enterocolitica]HDL7895730.1 hypothetical protein [Yersinia enterocolitica]